MNKKGIIYNVQCSQKYDTKYVYINIMYIPFTNPFKCLRKWAIRSTMETEKYGKVPRYNKEECCVRKVSSYEDGGYSHK